MSVMTEEEMDYQIELNEFYSNKNDSTENLYEFTETELSVHDERIRADERRKFIDFMAEHTNCRTDCENILCCDGKRCWNKYFDMYEKEQKNG